MGILHGLSVKLEFADSVTVTMTGKVLLLPLERLSVALGTSRGAKDKLSWNKVSPTAGSSYLSDVTPRCATQKQPTHRQHLVKDRTKDKEAVSFTLNDWDILRPYFTL
jgi:hypothetical protein